MNLINKGDRILIAGDSWGCGEWAVFGRKVAHLGLELYFNEYGCPVTNVSVGGYSNIESINSIKNKLIDNTYDAIIWFQTDPIRDLRPYKDNGDKFALEIDEFLKMHDELLIKNYTELNSLGPNLLGPVICLGGCSDITPSLINDYSNLKPAIPSIVEFFGCKNPPLWVPGSRWLSDEGITISKSIVNYMYDTDPKWTQVRFGTDSNLNKKWFFPDGYHPNRHALKEIFDYLIDFKLPD
jgi:hypothetical protein